MQPPHRKAWNPTRDHRSFVALSANTHLKLLVIPLFSIYICLHLKALDQIHKAPSGLSGDHVTSRSPAFLPLTKSSQKAINILIPPSAVTAKPPKGQALGIGRAAPAASCWARGFLGFISLRPGGQLWFSRGHGGRTLWAERSPHSPPALSTTLAGLRAPPATARASWLRLMHAASPSDLEDPTHSAAFPSIKAAPKWLTPRTIAAVFTSLGIFAKVAEALCLFDFLTGHD